MSKFPYKMEYNSLTNELNAYCCTFQYFTDKIFVKFDKILKIVEINIQKTVCL